MAAPTRFTEKAQEAIVEAQRETQQRRLSQLEPETLLRALVDQDGGIIPQVLLKIEVDPARISLLEQDKIYSL